MDDDDGVWTGDGDEPEWLRGIRGRPSRRLIESKAKVIRVLAGPGAGKTTCLIKRVLRLAIEENTKRADIFVGSFTRVITRAIHNAFVKPLPSADSQDGGEADFPVIRTIHAHAAQLLRENAHAAQRRSFRYLLQHEETIMLYDVESKVPQFDSHEARFDELRKLQAFWARPRTLDDARFHGAVKEWLITHSAMLIGEVVYLATDAIQNGNMVPKRFQHVFIDEYQDLTECEQSFVDFITADEGSIVALGDNDQSIYGFRYNNPDGINEFPTDSRRRRELDDIPLERNFRCGEVIVALANEIAAELGTAKEPMKVAVAERGNVEFVVWDSLEDEIAGIAKAIAACPEKFLVLVTRQFMGYRIKALVGDDAVTTFREEVLAVDFVRERFSLASLLANEDDSVAVRAWLALEHNAPKQANHRNVVAYERAASSGAVGLDLIKGVADGTIPVTGTGQLNVKARCTAYLAFKNVAPTDLSDCLRYVFDPALVDTMPGRHVPAAETPGERNTRERLEQQDREKARGDLDLLRRASLEMARADEDANLAKIVTKLRYLIGTTAPLLEDESAPRIRIMSLHGAKGLDEESVIVAGLADEMIPGPAKRTGPETAKHVAEQRRLLYVAVTRAKRSLVLSWSTSVASADTHGNAIVKNRGFPTANGYHRELTRTSLLPPAQKVPTSGRLWLKSKK